ncbi:hypothetical protein BC6307_06520 [Sutcliffiella cohnii]|uniref:Uncharacterized protein n=1 Tax=Sutcliffiella cohnii TaxID=33932 RepID=A0A223KNH8_9BACI|nr:hypothetical protein [Sutcliffiella cohnii]AST90957.1 hypothetical protein BC6307_06520 [Sutcliffiella cohnii]
MEKVKAIVLFSRQDKPRKVFKNMAEAQRYCVENMICNQGWVTRSLETGQRFYEAQDGGYTISHNGYEGHGMYVRWAKVKPGVLERRNR